MDHRSSSISLYPVGCKRRSCMFTCSVDQGGRRQQIPASLIRTVVVYYTQVSQVRIEGTELRKRYGKKEMKKNVPSLTKWKKRFIHQLVCEQTFCPHFHLWKPSFVRRNCLSYIYGAQFRNGYSCQAAAGTELGKGDTVKRKKKKID